MDMIAFLLPQGSLRDQIIIMASAALAFITVLVVVRSYSERAQFTGRIKSLQERRQQLRDALQAPKKRKKQKAAQNGEVMTLSTSGEQDIYKTLSKKMNLLQDTQARKYRELLAAAGIREKNALFRFAVNKVVLMVVVGMVAALAVDLRPATLATSDWQYFVFIGGLYLGLKMPDIFLINRRNKRWQQIQKALSDALDLMMVCAEAGLTLSASLDRVSKELGLTYPELADELSLTAIEMSFLPERRTALENLQKRVNLPEVRGIVSVLIQTEKYGTPVAQALRTLAAEYRTQRMLRAEQKAARLPAIMTIPMIVFILPALFVVLLTPAIIKLLDESG